MKIRTAKELKELNEALNNCTDTVWLMGPNDECYNMKNEEEYIEGIIRLAEDHDNQDRERSEEFQRSNQQMQDASVSGLFRRH